MMLIGSCDQFGECERWRAALRYVGSPRRRRRSRPILRWLRSAMRVCWTFRLERCFPLSRPQFPRAFAVLALELVGYPEQRAVDHGAVVSGEVHDPGLNDEAAEFDQMPGALAALDLPCPHVMPCLRRLMPVARRPVAVERRQRRDQAQMQIAATGPETTRPRASPMPPSFRRP